MGFRVGFFYVGLGVGLMVGSILGVFLWVFGEVRVEV